MLRQELPRSTEDHLAFRPAAHTPPMSAECETVGAQQLPPAATQQPIVSTPPITSSAGSPEGHNPPSGISYEGRVSVIPPLAGYEATMRAAMDLEATSSAHHDDPARHLDQHRLDLRRLYEQRAREDHERRMHENSLYYGFPKHLDMGQQQQQQQQSPLEDSAHQQEPSGYQTMTSADPPKIKEEIQDEEPLEGFSQDHHLSQQQQQQQEEDAKATVLRYAQTTPEQNTDPEKSPIEKPGESPDLPTDSARTQMDSDRHHHLHHHHEDSSSSSFKQHNDSFDDNMSLYADIGSEDRRGSTSIGEGDLDDTLDSSSPIEGSTGSGGDLDPLARLQHALQRSGMITMSDQDDVNSDPQKQQVFQCHLCSYTGTSRFHFNAHLNTHYDHKCTKCEFTTRTEAKLHEHLNVEHGINLDAIEDTDGIRVPRVNAQGKVKTFKCKQCGYVAITKSDFWEHARTHIKSEKLLTCPKCPFVTEYKHHLEYHLRNHFGSKPFKCNKCNYSCVNKSMLNSHMKSHSNVYQYRCADCTYATKYCHSLKLHLRKYAHSPAMVLNPDGTPNPVPIIDVYGTRRGPKIKKDENGMPILPPHYQLQAQLLKAQMEAGKVPSSHQQPAELPQQGPKGGQTPVPPPPTSQQSPLPYPYSMMSGHGYQTSSPILSRALERSPEEAPRAIEGREQLRELLLERERTTQMHRMSPEAKGAIKCTMCDFATGSREVFAQHMMIHTASEKTEIPESHEASRSKSPSVERSITPDRRQPSPPPTLQVPPYAPLVCPTVSEAGPHQFSTLAAAHNLKEYLARAMNPFLYPQGVVHPALGLQHHLQRLGHPVFQRPEELKEEGPHFFQQHHPHQMHLQQQQHHPHHHHQQQQQQQQQQQHQLHQMTHVSPRASPQLRSPRMKETPSGDSDSALDLSKEQSTPPMSSSSQPQVRPQNSSPTPSPYNSSPPSSSPPRSETSTPPTKNRRKGRAFKLERIALRLSESAEGESSGHEGDGRKEDEGAGAGFGAGPGSAPSPARPMDPRIPPLVPMDTNEPNSPRKQEEDEEDRQKMEVHQEWEYQCHYCDMAFKDVVMYTMHMGYHDYKNPFTCNMCGHQATDKVSFFLHIARSSHA